jgi:2,3-dihydroxyphenylpropionate 1,2-dioxygenase
MSTIVAGLCVSHATAQNTALPRTKDRESADRFLAGVDEARRVIEKAQPDVLVVAGSNHFHGVFLDLMPAFTLGVGECDAEGEGETPVGPFIVDAQLGQALAWGLAEREFDIAISLRLHVDHGIAIALQQMTPDLDVPFVPLVINSFAPPLPTMARCRALGEAVRSIVEADGEDKRVAIVGTGGISHHLPFIPKWWIEPETEADKVLHEFLMPRDQEMTARYAQVRGETMKDAPSGVNPEFDEEIMDLVVGRDWDALLGLTDDQIEERGGNGAQEIRAWVFAASAVDGTARKIAYAPMHEWHTGMGVVALA